MLSLSPEQKLAFDAYKAKKNIFVTGPGGTGKSELIRTIVADAKMNNKKIQVCATTGCAAELLRCGARTIHSWAGIGLANGCVQEVVNRVISKKQKQANWKKTDILIIDEISMMSAKLLHILDIIARRVKTALFPFGGIQVLFFGDFYQLPPVGDKEDPETMQFAFEYIRWNEIVKETIVLSKVFRQTNPDFVKTLHQLRVGKLSRSGYNRLMERVNAELETPNGILPTRLLPLKRHVEAINQRHMSELVSQSIISKVELFTEPNSKEQNKLTPPSIDYEHNYLLGNCLCEQSLELKVGAQVMCIANIDMEGPQPICNGSQGIITRFVGNHPEVQFTNGRTMVMTPFSWKSEKFPQVGIKQVPLILAWAITIHKSQGATLEYAEVDAGSGVFECGQTYVALSRVKSFEGLRLTAFDYNKVKIDRRVMEFYKNIESKTNSI